MRVYKDAFETAGRFVHDVRVYNTEIKDYLDP